MTEAVQLGGPEAHSRSCQTPSARIAARREPAASAGPARLLQLDGRGRGRLGVHGDELGAAQAQARQVGHAARLRRAEQQRLAPARQVLQDGVHRRRKALAPARTTCRSPLLTLS